MTTHPATGRQVEFVNDLLGKKQVPDHFSSMLADAIANATLTKSDASAAIDQLLAMPNKPKPGETVSGLQGVLGSIPKSKYAITTEELELAGVPAEFKGDIAFFELKEYLQRLYIRQLHGAPGHFNRSKIPMAAVEQIVSIIKNDPYKYAKLFGDHYSCCGSCGAELTDQRSRELMLGPECRKKFGF
jgi:hypothetical protein